MCFDTAQSKKQKFFAIFSVIFRISRCNQLFSGGFDYPVADFSAQNFTNSSKNFLAPAQKIQIKYYFFPKNHTKFYVVKAFHG